MRPAIQYSVANHSWRDTRQLELHGRFIHEGRPGEVWVSKDNDRFRVDYDRSPWTIVGSLSDKDDFLLKNSETGELIETAQGETAIPARARNAREMVMMLKFFPFSQL